MLFVEFKLLLLAAPALETVAVVLGGVELGEEEGLDVRFGDASGLVVVEGKAYIGGRGGGGRHGQDGRRRSRE